MNTPLYENDRFELQGHVYRFLGLLNGSAKIIPYGIQKPLPTLWNLKKLEGTTPQNSFRILPPPEISTAASKYPSNERIGELRWSRIEGIVNEPGLYHPRTRGPLLADYARRIGVTKETLLVDLRLWWLGGQTQAALNGGYDRCGRISQDTIGSHAVEVKGQRGTTLVIFAPATTKSRGRKPTHWDYSPFVMTRAARDRIIAKVQNFYLQDEIRSVRKTAEVILEEDYCYLDEHGEPKRDPKTDLIVLRPRGQRPSIDQVRRIIALTVASSTRIARRTTNSNFENNHAPATSDVNVDCKGPADVYEIDATFIDLWIVAKGNRSKIIGKATLYLVIDRHSRLLVGFYASLENPSWCEARMAILSIAGDWAAICKQYKVKYRPEDWPAQNAMSSRITGDRGEMISRPSEQLAKGVEISVTNPPARRAKGKCLVESGFITVQVPLKDNVPGYEPPRNAKARSGKKYSKDACFTLDDLIRYLLLIVIKHNRTPLASYPLSAEQVYSGFIPTPINNWNFGIKNLMGTPKRFSYQFLRDNLCPKGVATVKVDGIHFKDCIYECQEAFENDWMTRASVGGSFAVGATYVENLVDTITVQDPFGQYKSFTASLAPKSKQFAGYSFAEVKAYYLALKKLTAVSAEDRTTANVTLSSDAKKITEPAMKAMKAATKGMRHGTRFNSAPDARQEEARSRRQDSHHPDAVHTSGGPLPETPPGTDVSATGVPPDLTTLQSPEPTPAGVPSEFATDLFNLLDQV